MRNFSFLFNCLLLLNLAIFTSCKILQDLDFDGDDDDEFDLVDVIHEKRQWWPEPNYPAGSYLDGWESLPSVSDADGQLIQEWPVQGASIPVYIANRDPQQVTRAIVIPPGMRRDCWYYYRTIQSGLVAASQADGSIHEKEIDVMSPCFLYYKDLETGAAVPGNFVWKRTTWVSGQYNLNEDGPQHVPSFQIMDDIVDYYMDKTRYPNLKTVVIAGHSAGAQMVQRYLMLRKPTLHDDRLQFWIGNPSTFAWLSTDRPVPNATCEGVDSWKYGLTDKFPGYSTGDATRLGRSGLIARYFGRYTHYLWGTIDNIVGDTRCQAMTQGTNHYDRGRNFAEDLQRVAGNRIPTNTTIQYLDVWHDVEAIVHQTGGWDYLFRWLPGMPQPPTAGAPPGSSSTAPGPITTTTSTTTSTAPSPTQTKWGQCGGEGWTGPTDCEAGSTCTAVSPPYYSQCI